MKRRTLAAIVSMGALVLPPAAFAGSPHTKQSAAMRGSEGQSGMEGQSETRTSAQRSAQQASRIVTVRGELLDLRTARLRQDRNPHLLARVRLDSGRTAVIDLGRAQTLRDQNIRFRRGEIFEAQGLAGRINQRPVLVAQRFRSQDQPVVQVTRLETRTGAQPSRSQQSAQLSQEPWWSESQPGQQQAMQQRAAQQARQSAAERAQRTIRGEVLETRELKLKGVEQEHSFVKLRTDAGQIEVVDLGPPQALEGLILEKGERAVVRGTSARINGRPVLVARDVAQVARLDRSDFLGEEIRSGQGQQGQSQQSQQSQSQQSQSQQGQQGQ